MPICVLAPLQAQGVGVNITETGMLHRPQARWVAGHDPFRHGGGDLDGAAVTYDTHGDGDSNKLSYETGRGVPDQTGERTAAFTGSHGWFWRNRFEASWTLTLRTAGDYAMMKRP